MDSQAVCQLAEELFPIPSSFHQNRELLECIFLRQKIEYCLQKNWVEQNSANDSSIITLQTPYYAGANRPNRPAIECRTPLFDRQYNNDEASDRVLLNTVISQLGISTSPFDTLSDMVAESFENLNHRDSYHFYKYPCLPLIFRVNSHVYMYSLKLPFLFPELILPIQQVSWGGLTRYFNLPPEKVPLCYCGPLLPSNAIILTDDLYIATYFYYHHSLIQKSLTIISWFGGREGLNRLDLQTAISLKGHQVYFLLSPHAGLTLLQQYQIADQAYITLKDIVRIKFLTNIVDGQDADTTEIATTPAFRILSFKEFHKRFDILSTPYQEATTPAYPINSYMSQGGLYIFYPTSLRAEPHLETVYGPLALGCQRGELPWKLGANDRTAFIIRIGSIVQLSTNDQQAVFQQSCQSIIQNYRLSTGLSCENDGIFKTVLQSYINISKWKNDFNLMENIETQVKILLDKHFSPFPQNQEVIVIIDIPDLAEWEEHSPLGRLLNSFKKQKFITWLVFHKVLSPKQLTRIDPDGVWEITRAIKAQTLLLQVDIFSKGYSPKSSFELHARRGTELYYLYQPKSKYASLVPIIKKYTMEGYKEVDILNMVNLIQARYGVSTPLTLYTLRQLKRQFNIRTYTHVARRRTRMSDKIQSLHKEGKSPAEIAKRLKLAPYYVRKRLEIIQAKLS